MSRIAHVFELINKRSGQFFAWSSFILVLIICVDVFMRYVFNTTKVWVIELETYFFAICILMGSGYAFQKEKHVRVDVFYTKWSKKRQAWVNLMGGVLLLLPWAGIATFVCFNYFLKSWKLGESSAQPGGLPALYVLKFILFLGFLFLLLQGIASVIRSIQVIAQSEKIKE